MTPTPPGPAVPVRASSAATEAAIALPRPVCPGDRCSSAPADPAKPPPAAGEMAAQPDPYACASLAPGEADPAEPSPVSLGGGGIPAWLGQEGSDGNLAWPDAEEADSAELSLADGGFPPADGTGPVWPGSAVHGVAGAGFLAGADEPDRMARAALGYLADPGDPVLGGLLRHCTAAQVVAALVAGQHPLAGRPPEAAAARRS